VITECNHTSEKICWACLNKSYVDSLQQAIECHCKGELVPNEIAEKCQDYAELLNNHWWEE